MQLLKDYLSRYVRDAVAGLLSFGVAAFGILPMVAITYREYALFVYLFIACMGLPLILAFAVVSSIFASYRYKILTFVTALVLLLYRLRNVLIFDPPLITPGAVNWNRIIFAQLLFATAMIYFFRERHRIRARWQVHTGWE